MKLQHAMNHPLDGAMIERLHLRSENSAALKIIRGLIHSSDAVSRTLFGHPFLALRESEDFLRQMDGLEGADLIHSLMEQEGGTTVIAHGLQHIPDDGPIIIAATHPTGMFDFAAHASALLDKRPDMKVVANREAEKFVGSDIIIQVTVDKRNKTVSGGKTQQAMQAHLKDGGALLIFGSGRVPDFKQGHLVEPAWRRGATTISKLCQAPIVAAALNARNSNAYYRTRAFARFISGGNDHFGAMIASLRYSAELLEKLGGKYDVLYSPELPPGTDPATLKHTAEGLVPGLYQT
ncbi:hypothetical protein DL239_01445 [Sedimentitalea sp. CY04]|uniref:Phospholipid/glycerol acyltransferase domain-containing protein n=1 Tax=Parasedimentitalea denitrificans TaxID=2211118 RepID=A0ABX0W1Y3_9RHOB|nr:hypothetical protein [Sedimentitalea sp. CY04]NIZ59634.1 hypothetical protein [Sedimentitalea sp. CY04]